MSEPGKAVFLSYASQDAEAAKRICEALRSSGVEVWFDADGGLEHGDEWDAKIRRQIKECVLFIAVISASTQAREEGYFRIEWELAAQRAMGIASGVAFILPVVVDDTREPDALVPDRFRMVQWTKLPGGVVPPDVQARFLKLWSHRTGVLRHAAGQERSTSPAVPVERGDAGGSVGKSRRGRFLPAGLTGAAILVLGLWLALKSASGPKPADARPVAPTAPAAGATGESSEGRRLVAKVWELLNKPDLSRTELDAAEALCQRAIALDPSDADALSAGAQVDTWYIYYNFDGSPARTEGARDKAMRALHLAPRSFEARLAQANYWVRSIRSLSPAAAKDVESVLLELAQERPDEPRTLYTLAMFRFFRHPQNPDLATLARLEKSPAFAVAAAKEAGWQCFWAGRYAEADRAADRSIALLPYWDNLGLKVELALHWQGDLDLAKATLDRLPPASLQEDVGVALAYRVHHWRAEPLESVAVLEAMPKDWLKSQGLDGPRSFYMGQARLQAKQTEAARGDFRRALDLLGKRLADDPNNPWYLGLKAQTLLFLGESAEAAKTYRLFREVGDAHVWSGSELWTNLVMLFEPPAVALDYLRGVLQRGPTENLDWPITAASLRLDPRFDPIRQDPGFAALLVRVEADPLRSPHASPAAATAAPVADAKSVAVLAFANLSDDKGNEYFSDGISEELLNVLAKVPGLKVSARTSAFYFKGKEVPIPEIARQLGVAYVVEGSVRKQGEKVRITAQLIKAADGFHVWSDTFTRDLKDIFAVQDEIAGLIAQNLQLKLAVGGERATVNPDTYELLLQARSLAQHESTEGRKQAVALYRRILVTEPRLAVAWAEMAHAYMGLGRFGGLPIAEGMREARAAAQQALALDPDQPVGLDTLAWVQRTADWDWRGAQRSFERAMALAPGDPGIRSDAAVLYFNIGRVEEAIALARQAVERDPLNVAAQFYLGAILEINGRFEESIPPLAKAVELAPAADEFHTHVARALISLGRLAEAEPMVEREPNEAYRLVARAQLQHARGDRAGAGAARDELIAKYGTEIPGYVALTCAMLGDPEQAFAWLDRALARRDAAVAWAKTNYYLRSLHGDSRWPAFLARLGLADDQLK